MRRTGEWTPPPPAQAAASLQNALPESEQFLSSITQPLTHLSLCRTLGYEGMATFLPIICSVSVDKHPPCEGPMLGVTGSTRSPQTIGWPSPGQAREGEGHSPEQPSERHTLLYTDSKSGQKDCSFASPLSFVQKLAWSNRGSWERQNVQLVLPPAMWGNA